MRLKLTDENGYVEIPLDTNEVPPYHNLYFYNADDPTTVDRWDSLPLRWQQMVRHMLAWMRAHHPTWSLQIHTDRGVGGVQVVIGTQYVRQPDEVVSEIVKQVGEGLGDPIVL